MHLDFRNITDQKKAQVYLDKLITDQSNAELTKINKKRTNNQNRYLHAILTLYAGEWGWTTDEAKTYVKRTLGYKYEKNGEWFLCHTSDMDTKNLSIFIDRFRNLSASQGFYVPTSTEFQENYTELMNQISIIESMQNKYDY